jgi:hypothetical protein
MLVVFNIFNFWRERQENQQLKQELELLRKSKKKELVIDVNAPFHFIPSQSQSPLNLFINVPVLRINSETKKLALPHQVKRIWYTAYQPEKR